VGKFRGVGGFCRRPFETFIYKIIAGKENPHMLTNTSEG